MKSATRRAKKETKERINMKTANRLLIMTAALAFFASAGQIQAGTKPCCDDGIAASPKVRQMLDERKAQCCAQPAAAVTTSTTRSRATIAASPRVQQMRNERAVVSTSPSIDQTVGYRATRTDGTTASPKDRQTRDERRLLI